MIKTVIAGMSLLLCLAGDPIQMLQAPFVLLQTANQPAEPQGLTKVQYGGRMEPILTTTMTSDEHRSGKLHNRACR